MMRWTTICCILLCISPFLSAEEGKADPNSKVLTLDASNFQQTIDENPVIAIEFYAPWCGHCKALAPEWEKAAQELHGKVPLGKVDCTEHQSLCQQFEVQGFPTLKIFRSGEAFPFEVARKSEAIVQYLLRELEPAVTELTADKLDAFLETHPVTLVAYLDNNHDDRSQEVAKVAKNLRQSLSFVSISNPDDKKNPSLVLRRNYDEPALEYAGEISSELIKPWLVRHLVPLVGEINADTFQSYMSTNLPVGYVFLNPKEDNSALLKNLVPAATKHRDTFVLSWINNEKYGQQASRLGLSGKAIPALSIDSYPTGEHFVFPENEDFNAEAVAAWLDKFAAKELSAHIKSEPIPETNDGPVKILVAHNFKEIVEDSTKDVLVEFYAPWCGHCKALAPTFDALGNYFKPVSSVVIAKIDATANDVSPSFNIRGFPTIKLFPADNKLAPVDYEGNRELSDIALFVHRSAAIKFDLPASLEQKEEQNHDHDEL